METPATQSPPGLRVCTDYRTPAMDKRTQSSSSSSSSSNSSSLQLPKPMEALQEMGPPPFLLKTFEMVEDPATDSVVSWSKARNSFIVWDYCKLSVDVLPKYFKHGNFCSFVRQLNTYGFRKVDPDRYEFANEGFLGGQKHLLKTVKRRRNSPNNFPQGRTNNFSVPFKSGLESEIELLKTDKDTLMVEVLKLRQEHQASLREIGSIEERLKGTEKKQHLMLAFLAKVIKNQSFVEKLALQNKQKKALTGGGGGGRVDDGAGDEFVPKKRRLPHGNSTENLQNSEIETPLIKAPIQDGMVMGDTHGTGNTSWEELLNQDAFNEDEAVSDLTWGENVQVLVQQMGHLGSKQ